MNNSEKYKKVFNHYYDSNVNEKKILQMKKIKNTSYRSKVRKWSIAFASFIFLLSGSALVSAAVGWIDFADIFQNGFDDSVSADLVNEGIVQNLDIVNENDDFILKLVALTGDTETQVALFKLTPKTDLDKFNEISLLGQTITPCILKDGSYKKYAVSEIKGFKLIYDEDKNAYFFRYQIPPYWITELDEDIILNIKGINFYDKNSLTKSIKCDMKFSFTPNRAMLEPAHTTLVNQSITKKIFDYCSFTDDYSNKYLHTGDIIAPTKEESIQITDVIISNYKTTVNGTILEKNIDSNIANIIWTQFTHPKFVTNHYWNGVDDSNSYDLAVVNNTNRLRLFVDDVEIPIKEDSLSYVPGKGHDKNGNLLTEGYNSCAIEFDGFDYYKAGKIEIHFGNKVIPIK